MHEQKKSNFPISIPTNFSIIFSFEAILFCEEENTKNKNKTKDNLKTKKILEYEKR